MKFVIHNEQERDERFAVNYTPKKGFNEDTRTIRSGGDRSLKWKVVKTYKIKDRSGTIRWRTETTYECKWL